MERKFASAELSLIDVCEYFLNLFTWLHGLNVITSNMGKCYAVITLGA